MDYLGGESGLDFVRIVRKGPGGGYFAGAFCSGRQRIFERFDEAACVIVDDRGIRIPPTPPGQVYCGICGDSHPTGVEGCPNEKRCLDCLGTYFRNEHDLCPECFDLARCLNCGGQYHEMEHDECPYCTLMRGYHLRSITDQRCRCACGWAGTVWDCEGDVDEDGSLGCPECLQVVTVEGEG